MGSQTELNTGESLEGNLLEAGPDAAAEVIFRAKTIAPNIQLKLHWYGLDQKIFMCWSGSVKVQC